MTLTKAHNRMIAGAPVNVLDYGAVGDGVTDDTAAIQAAIDYAESLATGNIGVSVSFPSANYATTSSLTINDKIYIHGNGSVISPSSSTLEAIKIGDSAILSNGGIENLIIDRGSYSGATENAGIAFYNCTSFNLTNVESRYSKYNFWLKPAASQRVAYSIFNNVSAVGGLYNLYFYPSSDGFANENTFIGGRLFDTSDTTTQLYMDTAGSARPDHNRFIGVSMEGAGDQSIYCNGGNNYFEFPRTEGTWSVDDIVLGTASAFNIIISSRYDLSVTDNGNRNQYLTYGSGFNFVTATNDITTLDISRLGANTGNNPAVKINDTYSASGNSFGIEYRAGRDTDTSFLFKSIRDSDSLVRSSLTTNGKMYVAQQLDIDQSGWNFNPLILGGYHLWIDSSGRLRIKSGAPASDTDGVVVGTQT